MAGVWKKTLQYLGLVEYSDGRTTLVTTIVNITG